MNFYLKLKPRSRLLHFINAREQMRVHKQLIGGPGPHSEDTILANHRFCNINREHDTVTRFIHQKFRVPFKDRGKQFMVRQMLFCRIFNEPPVLSLCCPFTERAPMVKKLQAYRDQGNKVMRGAYMMPPHGKNVGGVDVIDHWCEVIEEATAVGFLRPEHTQVDYEAHTTLAQVAEGLMRVCGLGGFIANQVCTDLRYVPVWGHSWTDWGTFIICGPGTKRGMARLDGKEIVDNKVPSGSDESFTARLLAIRDDLLSKPDDYHTGLVETLRDYYRDPNNLSNTFCEWDKYERAQLALSKGTEVNLRKWSAANDGQLDLL